MRRATIFITLMLFGLFFLPFTVTGEAKKFTIVIKTNDVQKIKLYEIKTDILPQCTEHKCYVFGKDDSDMKASFDKESVTITVIKQPYSQVIPHQYRQ